MSCASLVRVLVMASMATTVPRKRGAVYRNASRCRARVGWSCLARVVVSCLVGALGALGALGAVGVVGAEGDAGLGGPWGAWLSAILGPEPSARRPRRAQDERGKARTAGNRGSCGALRWRFGVTPEVG